MRSYYVHPNEITNNTFILTCKDSEFILDTDLTVLNTLTFKELLQISQKVRVLARRRNTKAQMISEIESHIVFEPPEV
jgi:hypothetical protein